MKKVAVIQSNYIPWKGYFDIIHDVDLFIFYDDVQYTKNDWRNRNRIRTPTGAMWLTIPVGSHIHKLIHEVQLKDPRWAKNHWKTINQYYKKTPFFYLYSDFFQEVYLGREWDNLSDLNQFLIKNIAVEFLGISTVFDDSRRYEIHGQKLDRILNLLLQAEAETYVSGPSGRDYVSEDRFREVGIRLIYKDYSGYPEYPQVYPMFDGYVSIIDLLFNVGKDTPYYIWGWRDK